MAYLWLVDHIMASLTGRSHHPGMKASLFGLGLGLDLLAGSLLRADPVPYWGSLAVDTWCALGLVVLCGIGFLVSLWD